MSQINGDEGNNILIGLEEDDDIYGFGGNDLVSGRGGIDFMDGGAGVDRLDYSYSGGGWHIDLLAQVAFSLGGPTEEVVANFENVFGSQSNDRIYGTNGANDLKGGAGQDILDGRAGNDVVEGEAGDDHLYGSGGEDILAGGPGNDILFGGALSDRFVIASSGVDLIMDFDGAGSTSSSGPSQDRLDIRGVDAIAASSGDNAFVFRGVLTDAEGFAFGAGSLWVRNVNGETRVRANTDGDTTIELTIRIADGAVAAGDYRSGDFLL